MNYVAQIRKALVPVVVAAALAGAGAFGVGENMTFVEGVTALVTGFLVWLIPNKTA